MSNC